MNWEIAFILILMLVALGLFVWEKISADVVALGLVVVLLASGILTSKEAFSVFSNPAPLAVAALFVLCEALVRSGGLDALSKFTTSAGKLPYAVVILLLVFVVGGISAFVNNTPVVVVFLPVVLALARNMKLAPSKLLIPLSYAAVLGGTITLIGTSTNLVTNGYITSQGLPGFGMFEMAWIGVPITIVGAIYMAVFGKRLLPDREMLTSILSEDERREYITDAFVQPDSPHIGKTLVDAGLTSKRGIRVLELVRDGVAFPHDPQSTTLEAGDRLMLSCRLSGIATTRQMKGVDLTTELNLGLEQIAAHEGSLVEAVIPPHSPLVGQSIRELNFRHRYRLVALALHREGKNVRDQLAYLPLAAGDVLLRMGTDTAIDALRGGEDLVLFDRLRRPSRSAPWKLMLTIAAIATTVTLAALEWVPIEVGALTAAVVLCASGCLKTKDAYNSIEWPVLFLIYGMLAFGLAMEKTGTDDWMAQHLVDWVRAYAAPEHQAMWLLAGFYLLAMVLTEILSNNAVAALMAPLAIGVAQQLGVDSRPFLIALTVAASAAFATPIGYQTNTYVYGVGGYRFMDFVKIGVPLNLMCFGVAMLVIPHVWPFVAVQP